MALKNFLSFHSNWTPRPAYSTGIAYAAFPSSRLNGFYFTNGIQYLKIIFLASLKLLSKIIDVRILRRCVMYRDTYADVNKSVAYTGVKGIIEMIQKHGEWSFVGCV